MSIARLHRENRQPFGLPPVAGSAMGAPARRLAPVLVCALALTVSACGNERPSMPASTDAWHPADLPALVVGTSLDAIAFSGHDGYILGGRSGKAGTDYLLLARDPERHWVATRLADVPDNAVLLDVAAGASGLAIGGYLQQDLDPCLVYDERGEAPSAVTRSGKGIGAIDGSDTLMVAGGRAIGGALWASRAAGPWTNETVPLSQLHEGWFNDVFVTGDRAWACGFDGGSDTPPILLELDPAGGDWSKVPLGAGILGHELLCVAAGADGRLLLGGIAGPGGVPRPFARLREAGGDWTDLALPDADFLGDVNDVLPLADGGWLLACGGGRTGGMGTILRVNGASITAEMTPFHGAVLQLARDDDGLLHAVGYRLSAGASLRLPMLLTRD